MESPDIVPVAAYAGAFVGAVADELGDGEAQGGGVEALLGLAALLAGLALGAVGGFGERLEIVDCELGGVAPIVDVAVLVVALRVRGAQHRAAPEPDLGDDVGRDALVNRPLLEPVQLDGDDLVLLLDPAHVEDAGQRAVRAAPICCVAYHYESPNDGHLDLDA